MRIWLTAPFDDNGVQEVETNQDPTGDVFSVNHSGCVTWYSYWFKEGETWHRTKEAAIIAAKAFREERIKKATTESARLMQMSELVA